MINRPLYTRKYHSGRLKEFGYNINNTFDESKSLNEIIGLSDNQMLKSIRDVQNRIIDKQKLEILIKTRDMYRTALTYQQSKKGMKSAVNIAKKLKTLKIKNEFTKRLRKKYLDITINSDEAQRIQDKINRMLFNPDYVTVVMDNLKQYDYLYHNGFYINGKKYKRLSCGAGQARVSTVVFGNEEVIPSVKEILNNGRDLNKKISPSKFNAYFGLYGSATKVVSEPKFIVVKDYENTTSFMANYVIENGWGVDDTIVQKMIKDTPMNRTDGMGLISYSQALKWSKEMGLDYVPSQFCVRQSFLKGMLCVFPIHEFCRDINGGNYLVDTIYKDEDGNYIKADLREYDVIITESQFKLWDSFDSIDTYIDNCHKNKLDWRIALVSPKEAKRMLKLNYQFIQTLNLNQDDIEKLAEQFVEWLTKVSYDDAYYMLLFLLGVNNDIQKINNFLSSSEAYWIKSIIANHNVKNDKYIRTKIRELIKKKIENGCKGDIYVDGNFQVIVSDPYGFMQHVCGLPVTGLLKEGKSYSNYWNEQGVTQVDAMRSPLTYMSEHVILDFQKDDDTEKWYRYCKLGIILNYHGHETFNFAGSDFDMDILATTSNRTMIKGVYKDELPVVYDAPKPKKFVFTEDDLYESDTFSFGSIIGSITNKSSNGYAKLHLIEEKFGKNSQEYRLVKSRLQQCCKAQSAQIDKAKIGQEVKGIPKVWINRNRLKKNKQGKIIDKHAVRKTLYNNTLLDKYPYFFRYVYKDTNREYKKYLDECNVICKQKYKMNFHELESQERKTKEQEEFIANFYEFCPVLISNSPMNLLCKYLENINFNISQKTKADAELFDYEIYKRHGFEYTDYYKDAKSTIQEFISKQRNIIIANSVDDESENSDDNNEIGLISTSEDLFEKLGKVNKNPYIIVNCLVDYFYKEKPNSNKDLLWTTYGKYIYRNIVENTGTTTALFPMPCSDEEKYDLQYLGYNYKLQEVKL
ncbi:MAG: hypothetical protein HDR24_09220 [Lachnospiraceae bacterium]|nr:hypothetical protein [Lachnospiraceae bacterium]